MPTLNWIGKEAVVKHHKDVPYRLLEPVAELSCSPRPLAGVPKVGNPLSGKPDAELTQGPGERASGNLIVQGDNLHALKALLPRYAGQVKCIYIDPPYNTGNEGWAYNDNVNSPEIRKWLGEVVGKEGETLDRHDRWLCMMYPRLLLLKQFLREDGAIFVSMDDNEAAALRLLMDEVFGEKNFIAQFVWNTEGHTDNQFHIKVNHEYVLMYACRQELLDVGHVVDPNTREGSNLWAGFAENSITKNGAANPPSEITLPVGFPCESETLRLTSTELPKGIVESMEEHGLSSNQIKAKFGKVQFPLRFDPMTAKNFRLTKNCRVFSGWANANKLKAFIANRCEPMLDDDGLMVRFYLSSNGVIYYRKDRGDQARNIVSVLRNLSTTEKMRSELEGMGLHFKYPKPKELIKYLVRIGAGRNDIVLDSFAGSGTTAQAVLEQNAEDGGNRNFILVELDNSIARNVTAERVRRVAQGYTNGKEQIVEGVGGDFQFCTLSKEPLFTAQGQIRADVTFAQLAEFVWFVETGTGFVGKANSPLLGVHEGRAIYLLYNGILKDKSVAGGNVLTGPVYDILPPHDGTKVIFAAASRLGAARLAREQIVFKQTPYALEV